MVQARKHGWWARRRLVVVFLVLGLLPLGVLTFSVLTLSRHAVTVEVDARVQSSAQTFAAFTANSVSEASTAVKGFGSQAGLGDALVAASPDGVQRLESQSAGLLFTRPDLSAVLLLDSSGHVIAGDPAASWEGRDLGYLSWVSRSIRTRNVVVSDAFISPSDGTRVLAISIQVGTFDAAGEWRIAGLAVGIYSLQALQGALNSESAKDDMSVYILDSNTMQIVGPGLDVASLIPAPRGVLASTRRSADVTTVQTDTGAALSTVVTVPQSDWHVVAQVPTAHALAGLRKMRALVIAIAGLLTGFLLLALWFMLWIDQRRWLLQERTDRQAKKLADSEQLFRTAFVHAPAGIAWVNERGEVSEANLAFHEMLGYADRALFGRSLLELTADENASVLAELEVGSESTTDTGAQVEIRLLHCDSQVIWTLMSMTPVTDQHGGRSRLVQVVDITERKAAEGRLNDQAMHDPLTGLPNRALLESRINTALARVGAADDPALALMFIDLDGFKEINDRLGHQAGDEVLIETGARLERSVRDGDTVARLGGDEFVVLCVGIAAETADGAYQLGIRALDAVSQAGSYRGHTWCVSASIGISRLRQGGRSFASLLTEADSAMYRAKQQGKGCVVLFEPALDVHLGESAVSEEYLATAVDRGRLQLRYQPVIDVRSGAIVGAEALLRLLDPAGKELAPAQFLSLAEAHGHIVAFGESTLMEACRQAVAWKTGIHPDRAFSMAVNMSVKEVEDAGFLDRVDTALQESGLCPTDLVIELTESAFLRDLPANRSALQGLRDRGVLLALDDFGTGFSSLSYLRRFPVDIIKIDKSFVDDLGAADPHAVRVTEAIVALARTLRVTLVAEGVETDQQLDKLLDMNCDLAQGYLLGRPVLAAEFNRELRAQSNAPQSHGHQAFGVSDAGALWAWQKGLETPTPFRPI